MNINQIIKLKITDMTDEGSAVGKIDNIAIFCDKGVVKDVVLAQIIKVKKNYFVANVKEILEKSDLRSEKKVCEIQDFCGGCQILDISYNNQLKIKKDMVFQKLTRIGKIDNPKINDVVGMDSPFRYRNKVQLPVGGTIGDVKIGFYRQKTHDIIPFKDCIIQDEINNEIIKMIKNYMSFAKIIPYNEKDSTGVLRHIVTKISNDKSQIMLILVTNTDKKLDISYLVEEIKKNNLNITSIIQNINKKNTNVILSSDNILLYGNDYITEYIDDLKFKIYPNSFFQVNYTQMEKMYNKALDYASIDKDDVVYDLYCGIGTISLLLAKRAKYVYGIEVVQQSITSAKENARENNIENVEFICGKVENEIKALIKKAKSPDIIVLDPARKGCEVTVLDTILSVSPKKIVYISCNPSTLARDLKILLDSGKYILEEVTPFDLFCHSTHIENVVLLSKI
ncbi:23S rRNA (uracil-5-)-methyltransferase RumA [[Eubacterium] yurii subsp. margaretiae ATCC 43715]|nr:23S rRNA (uracil-5-)-methyltransferase RumA [[Eubacterium] yurii subsp. margaretiae ATCC 43715]